ncbi:FtsW/RodA/SpoVE family cell cycle protein [Gloeocapsa sp. PCC 73106]|uniref:FtsW/RodA/SpoVE family cell cycle protein n=1 Tax=Gloeocapsa sp. PCC 73106 TaxID=102232 RepID=UPI00350E997F
MIRSVTAFIDPEVKQWSSRARLLHWLTFLWLLIGLVSLCSASFAEADFEHNDSLYYLKRQLIWCVVGNICFYFLVRTPIKQVLRFASGGFLIILGLILTTYLPGMGTEVNGATRWLALGPILIQPSELIKPFLVLQSALVFGRWFKISWEVRIAWLLMFIILLGAILLQPNLSTTALCGMGLWLIALAGGLPLTYLGGTAIAGVLTAVTSISLRSYQKLRVMSFLNPWNDPRGDGYQLIQSLLAIGSGGLWGTGLGLSQQKLFYLPIQYTDFIFAVFAEEFGFVGSLLLLVLLVTYATFALKVALKSSDLVQSLIAIGVMVFMVGQSLLHIGVATGILPTTGLPLPLFSYGGSSMISSLCLAGLLIRVARESNQAEVLSLW